MESCGCKIITQTQAEKERERKREREREREPTSLASKRRLWTCFSVKNIINSQLMFVSLL